MEYVSSMPAYMVVKPSAVWFSSVQSLVSSAVAGIFFPYARDHDHIYSTYLVTGSLDRIGSEICHQTGKVAWMLAFLFLFLFRWSSRTISLPANSVWAGSRVESPSDLPN